MFRYIIGSLFVVSLFRLHIEISNIHTLVKRYVDDVQFNALRHDIHKMDRVAVVVAKNGSDLAWMPLPYVRVPPIAIESMNPILPWMCWLVNNYNAMPREIVFMVHESHDSYARNDQTISQLIAPLKEGFRVLSRPLKPAVWDVRVKKALERIGEALHRPFWVDEPMMSALRSGEFMITRDRARLVSAGVYDRLMQHMLDSPEYNWKYAYELSIDWLFGERVLE